MSLTWIPRFRRIVKPSAALHLLLCAPLFAQQIEIKLVDGRNGRPMVGTQTSYVNVWMGKGRKDAIIIPFGKDGIARLQLTLDPAKVNLPETSPDTGSIFVANPVLEYDESLEINVPYVVCEPKGTDYSWLQTLHFSTKQILEQGYVSQNTCGNGAIPAKPGQIVIFVRPLTWLEKWKE